jgi:hypothetical protein
MEISTSSISDERFRKYEHRRTEGLNEDCMLPRNFLREHKKYVDTPESYNLRGTICIFSIASVHLFCIKGE